MSETLWITERMTLAIHSQQLALFGAVMLALASGEFSFNTTDFTRYVSEGIIPIGP